MPLHINTAKPSHLVDHLTNAPLGKQRVVQTPQGRALENKPDRRHSLGAKEFLGILTPRREEANQAVIDILDRDTDIAPHGAAILQRVLGADPDIRSLHAVRLEAELTHAYYGSARQHYRNDQIGAGDSSMRKVRRHLVHHSGERREVEHARIRAVGRSNADLLDRVNVVTKQMFQVLPAQPALEEIANLLIKDHLQTLNRDPAEG